MLGPFADWKDVSTYPDLQETEIELWVWEFLRRNSEYQRNWELESGLYPEFKNSNELVPSIYQHNIDPEIAIFTSNTKKGRQHYLDSYELQYLINPAVRRPELFFLNFRFLPGRVDSSGKYADLNPDLPEDFAYITIDLNYPIERQLFLARLRVEEMQVVNKLVWDRIKRGKQQRSSEWQVYLRVLDAEMQGVIVKEIANILYPHISNKKPDYNGNQTVRDDIESAKLLRDVGFKYFILQQDKKVLKARHDANLKVKESRHPNGRNATSK